MRRHRCANCVATPRLSRQPLEVEQVLERLEHVPVAQIPGLGSAEIHASITGLGVAHEPRVFHRIERPFGIAGAIIQLFVQEIMQHLHHRRFALRIARGDGHPTVGLWLVLPGHQAAIPFARDLRGLGVGLVQIVQHRADRVVGQFGLVARIGSCGAWIGQPGAQSYSTNLDQIAGYSVSGAAVSGMPGAPGYRGRWGPGASKYALGLPIDWNAIPPVMVAS
jgi:hypothetical protein